MNEPYFLEVDENGCSSCGSGRMWTIIGPDGTRFGQSWGSDPDDPSEPCSVVVSIVDWLNEAFVNGQANPNVAAMVDRFLGWPLPKDFGPDAGISFTPPTHPNGWPVGTNLLTADQARRMFEHALDAPHGKGVAP